MATFRWPVPEGTAPQRPDYGHALLAPGMGWSLAELCQGGREAAQDPDTAAALEALADPVRLEYGAVRGTLGL